MPLTPLTLKTIRKRVVAANYRLKPEWVDPDEFVEWHKEMKPDGIFCWWCQKKLTGRDVSLDHFMPLFLEGKHETKNLVLTCRKCNRYKTYLHPDVWAKLLKVLRENDLEKVFFSTYQPRRLRGHK